MIKLTQNSSNTVVLTLKETTTQVNPYYVFNIISDDSNTSKVFTSADISSNIIRYNEFVIELNSVEDLAAGVIDLPLKGFYKYEVYSTAVEFDLDLANATELVEVGKVYVEGSEQLTKVAYSDGNDSKVVYNG